MATLPTAERAVANIAKLTDDCLNPHHEDGNHKARVFASALRIGRGDAEWLSQRLLEAAASQPATLTSETWFGALYVVDFLLTTGSGSAVVRGGWDCAPFRGFPAPHHLLRQEERKIMKRIPLLAPVALTEDLPAHNLTRGQIGAVVEYLERDHRHALLVEFSDEDGQTCALVPLFPEQLMVLHRKTKTA